MLEKEGYIMLIRRATNLPNTSKFGGCIGGMPSVRHQFSDPNIARLLIDYNSKEIEVTDEFRRFCDHGFVGRDEQRFRRQISRSTSALVIAITALLLNIFFNLLPKFTGGTKIKQDQIDILVSGLKSVENKVDSLNNTVIQYKSFLTDTDRLARNKKSPTL